MGYKRNRRRKRAGKASLYRGIICYLGILALFLTGLTDYIRKQTDDTDTGAELVKESEMTAETVSTQATTAEQDTDSTSEYESAVNGGNVISVGKPELRTREEAIDTLEVYGKSYSLIEDIVKNSAQYPDELLEALANNPEMAVFVSGWLDTHRNQNRALTSEEQAEAFPLFLQWDTRWGYHEYGTDSVIGLSGCGPTCCSMMLYYLTQNAALTPDVIADYSMDQGFYVQGKGTSWELMTSIAGRYGIKVSELSLSENVMKSVLDAGGVIICALRQGDFTAAGHFIVIYGYGDNGFYVNDPNCVARSRQRWKYETLAGQIRNLWGYTK